MSITSWSKSAKQATERAVSFEQALIHIDVESGRAKDASSSGCDASDSTNVVENRHTSLVDTETSLVSLVEGLGKTCANSVYAPHATPQVDTSAMDGFAVCSSATSSVSEDNPLISYVVGSIAAGDEDKKDCWSKLDVQQKRDICVEIMTGAPFPETNFPQLDAVVKVEDVRFVEDCSNDAASLTKCIQIKKAVHQNQHRRPAGSDFQKGAPIVLEGDIIEPKHIAALASLSISKLRVSSVVISEPPPCLQRNAMADLMIGIISTGSEIFDSSKARSSAQIRSKCLVADSNGPYLTASLKKKYPQASVQHLGIVEDDDDALVEAISSAAEARCCDIIITTGGVSKGRHDLIRSVVEKRMGGRVVFHGAKIRPGGPVLFAVFDGQNYARSKRLRGRHVAFFGAPGNPVAAAVAAQFFVSRHVDNMLKLNSSAQSVHDLMHEASYRVVWRERRRVRFEKGSSRCKPLLTTTFWLAKYQVPDKDTVEILDDQASYKVSALLRADCWVIVPSDQKEVFTGDYLECCSL